MQIGIFAYCAFAYLVTGRGNYLFTGACGCAFSSCRFMAR
jgi:hypothetical protein